MNENVCALKYHMEFSKSLSISERREENESNKVEWLKIE